MRITFSEAVESRFSDVQVFDVNGKRVDRGDVSAVDATTIKVSLGAIGDGGYTVRWKSVSAIDGHETVGSFAFAVGNAPLPTLPEIPSSPPPSPLELLGRALSYAGVALLVGVPAFPFLVARGVADPRTSLRLVRAGGALAVAGALAQLLSYGGATVLASRLGLLLAARAGIGAIALVPLGEISGIWIGVLAALTLTLTSHAAAGDDLVSMALDLVHVLAMGAWTGGLAVLALTALGRRSGRDLGALLGRFSTVALVAVGVIVVTGVLQSSRRLVDLRDLVETPYGLALLAKIVLLAVAVAIASLNLLRYGPRLRDGTGDAARTTRRLAFGVRGELAAIGLVLVAAAALTALVPPNASAGVAYQSVQHAGGLRIELTVQSPDPGQNRYVIHLQEGFTPPPDVDRVSLRFTMVEHDMGEQELVAAAKGPGEYVATGSPTAMYGHWNALVVVQRTDAVDARASFQFPISGGGEAQVTSVVPAPPYQLIAFTQPATATAGQPLSIFLVIVDPSGNPVQNVALTARVDGATYDATPQEGLRYEIDLPALTAGAKEIVLTARGPAGVGAGHYHIAVAP